MAWKSTPMDCTVRQRRSSNDYSAYKGPYRRGFFSGLDQIRTRERGVMNSCAVPHCTGVRPSI